MTTNSDRRHGVSRRPRCRPAIEGLEARSLLSYGGTPDLSFGGTGQVSAPPGFVTSAGAVEPNGKVVIAGVYNTTTPGKVTFALVQFNANGSLDSSFGVGGIAQVYTIHDGTGRRIGSSLVAVQPDGKILAIGPAADGFQNVTLVRLSSGGALDPSFGKGGIVPLVNLDSSGGTSRFGNNGPVSVAVAAGGAIEVGGVDETAGSRFVSAVARFHPDGTLDTTFGIKGLSAIATPGGTSAGVIAGVDQITIGSDGSTAFLADMKILGGDEAILGRLRSDGSLDPTFGTAGQTALLPKTIQSGVSADAPASLAIAPDGKLVVGGYVTFYGFHGGGESTQMFAARFTTAGQLDPLFGGNGSVVISKDSLLTEGTGAVIVQADGKVVLADSQRPVFVRLDPDGSFDNTFGTGGVTPLPIPFHSIDSTGSVALSISVNGNLVAMGGQGNSFVTRLLVKGAVSDFDDDGITDPAVYLPTLGIFAYRPSRGGADVVEPFGLPGTGQTLPASGAYGGNGVTELGFYLPAYGSFRIRPTGGGIDASIPFGLPGPDQTLPAPGDYDGSGQTEVAAYLPSLGAFAYRPALGGPDRLIPFGIAGPGQTLPAPGDYFGTGQTDIAAYLPILGAFALRSPSGKDQIIPFGIAGAGQSIPAPGDYDGSGQTELAVYLPGLGAFAYRPARGGPDVVTRFGIAGNGQSIPTPGDYDGSGQTDLAVYLPALGAFAYRPARGGPDVVVRFGIAGPGQTLPFNESSVANSAPLTVNAASIEIPITPDMLDGIAGESGARKRNQTGLA